MKCGLLGRHLSHSYSPQIHGMLGGYPYTLIEKEPEEIVDFLQNGDFTGINVTVPYKKTVIPYLDELSPVARRLGAVNTVVRRNGKLIGHNTDYFGFQMMVQKSGLDISGKKALVLGSGGASNTAVAVLQDLGADVTVISRQGEHNYSTLHLHADASLIVNTTPVGMYPNNGESPVNLDQFTHLEGVLDLIYNPAKTQLLLDAEKRNIPHVNGLLMLVAQAKESSEWFTDMMLSDDLISSIHNCLEKQMRNIILIGMPGSGKSTVGRLLAEKTGRKFVDADLLIQQLAKKEIPEIFAQDGDEIFRNWETAALAELGKQSGLVIATGGGCVTKERNFPLLHQNGILFWLQRDLEKLPTEGRPLSQVTRLEEMFQARQPLYRNFADHIIDNNGSFSETVSSILEVLQ